MSELQKLEDLYAMGFILEAEYRERKAALIGDASAVPTLRNSVEISLRNSGSIDNSGSYDSYSREDEQRRLEEEEAELRRQEELLRREEEERERAAVARALALEEEREYERQNYTNTEDSTLQWQQTSHDGSNSYNYEVQANWQEEAQAQRPATPAPRRDGVDATWRVPHSSDDDFVGVLAGDTLSAIPRAGFQAPTHRIKPTQSSDVQLPYRPGTLAVIIKTRHGSYQHFFDTPRTVHDVLDQCFTEAKGGCSVRRIYPEPVEEIPRNEFGQHLTDGLYVFEARNRTVLARRGGLMPVDATYANTYDEQPPSNPDWAGSLNQPDQTNESKPAEHFANVVCQPSRVYETDTMTTPEAQAAVAALKPRIAVLTALRFAQLQEGKTIPPNPRKHLATCIAQRLCIVCAAPAGPLLVCESHDQMKNLQEALERWQQLGLDFSQLALDQPADTEAVVLPSYTWYKQPVKYDGFQTRHIATHAEKLTTELHVPERDEPGCRLMADTMKPDQPTGLGRLREYMQRHKAAAAARRAQEEEQQMERYRQEEAAAAAANQRMHSLIRSNVVVHPETDYQEQERQATQRMLEGFARQNRGRY